MRLSLPASVHRPRTVVPEYHEGVVVLRLELGAVEIQSRLVTERSSRRGAERRAIATLVTEVGKHRNLVGLARLALSA